MKLFGRFLTFFMLTFFLQVHAAPGTVKNLTRPGKLLVAVDTTYPPMEFEMNDGKVVGFDVDLARELAKRLNLEAEFVVMGWDGILAGLQSKRYDVIISSMSVTAERQKQVDFVEYVKMGQVFVVRKKDAAVTSEKELKGKIIAVQADTTSFEAVENFKKQGVAIKDVKAFKAATDTFSALKSMQADVIVIDEPVGRYYAAKDSKTFVVSGMALAPEPMGVAVRKDAADLKLALEQAMEKIKKDGTLSKLSKNWFNQDLQKK